MHAGLCFGQNGECSSCQLLGRRRQGTGPDDLDNCAQGTMFVLVRQFDRGLPARNAAHRMRQDPNAIRQSRYADEHEIAEYYF